MKLLLELSSGGGKCSRGKMNIEGTNPKEIYEHINRLMVECYATRCKVSLVDGSQIKEYFTLSSRRK